MYIEYFHGHYDVMTDDGKTVLASCDTHAEAVEEMEEMEND